MPRAALKAKGPPTWARDVSGSKVTVTIVCSNRQNSDVRRSLLDTQTRKVNLK